MGHHSRLFSVLNISKPRVSHSFGREMNPVIALLSVADKQSPLLFQIFKGSYKVSVCVLDHVVKYEPCQKLVLLFSAEYFKNILFDSCQLIFFHLAVTPSLLGDYSKSIRRRACCASYSWRVEDQDEFISFQIGEGFR